MTYTNLLVLLKYITILSKIFFYSKIVHWILYRIIVFKYTVLNIGLLNLGHMRTIILTVILNQEIQKTLCALSKL